MRSPRCSVAFRRFPQSRPPWERRERTGTHGAYMKFPTVFGGSSRESQTDLRGNGRISSELTGIMCNLHGFLQVTVGIPICSRENGGSPRGQHIETRGNCVELPRCSAVSRGNSHGLLWERREPTEAKHGIPGTVGTAGTHGS